MHLHPSKRDPSGGTVAVDDQSSIVVVGASLGGLRCVEALRRLGHAGPLVLIGAEHHLPYDRPPLSKEVLTGEKTLDDIALTDSEKLADLEVDVRLGRAATGLDLAGSVVEINEEKVSFDALVIATGSHARRLPGAEKISGVHVIRTNDDVESLRTQLLPDANVVVIGGGFIGAEAAASARSLGCAVTVVEAATAPMTRGLGAEMGTVCGLLHTDNGTDLRVGVGVDELVAADSSVVGVRLGDGTTLDADVVIVGIGSAPTTGWLRESGLTVDDGVLCDETLAAVGGSGRVFAIGDVCRWPNAWNGETMRVEHWTNAVEQSFTVAKNVLAADGEAAAHSSVPFVWSDQYGHRIQIAGRPGPDDRPYVVAGSVDERSFVAAYRRGDALSGVMAIDMIRPFVTGRRLLMQHATWSDTLSAYAPTP